MAHGRQHDLALFVDQRLHHQQIVADADAVAVPRDDPQRPREAPTVTRSEHLRAGDAHDPVDQHAAAFGVDRRQRIACFEILSRDDAVGTVLGEECRPFIQPHVIEDGVVIVIEIAQRVAIDHSPIASRQ